MCLNKVVNIFEHLKFQKQFESHVNGDCGSAEKTLGWICMYKANDCMERKQ